MIEAVKGSHPAVRFLALSVSDAPEDVIAVIRAGRAGMSPRRSRASNSSTPSHRVAGGRRGLLAPPGRVRPRRLRGDARQGDRPTTVDPELDQLSSREREVLRLIARGYTYKEIAHELSISPKTVETHVSAVLRKLQLSTRHQLTYWATERRLV